MKIFIIGDSTAANKLDNKRPESGWGEHLVNYLSDDVTVSNHAVNGRSTKSFIDEKLFDEVLGLIKKDDYLLIQFGHNDSKIIDPNRYTDPFFSYQTNLSYFVNSTKAKGATAVILSSVSRRKFLSHHRVCRDAVGKYPLAAKFLAKREGVLFIDCFRLTKKLYEYLGEDDSKYLFNHLRVNQSPNYPNGQIDDTHFNLFGANVVAMLIAKQLFKLDSNLATHIRKERFLDFIKIKDYINAIKNKKAI